MELLVVQELLDARARDADVFGGNVCVKAVAADVPYGLVERGESGVNLAERHDLASGSVEDTAQCVHAGVSGAELVLAALVLEALGNDCVA